ncbi:MULTISPECIES: alpha-E domain-containing protein [unclassified Actinotalea]|uniref:alpha-E domain-containing protein n=1 Tax=unclassified Actinotalea TaxID=2638618 RepID=UPI0015F578CB|nr:MULTISPECIES: alpha-E domain-containing protein [unclassified Actinotalea]
MLSRIAESLFWIGRYVERAEDTARLLDVHLHALLEDPWAEEDLACRSLLAVMDREPEPGVPAGRRVVLEVLAYDAAAPASIAGALVAARENARRGREVISTELWEALNATWTQLPVRTRSGRPHDFLAWVRERAAVVSGIVDQSLSRDDTWQFLVLGRSIERADMTARLLAARALTGASGPDWPTLLRSCGAHEAYLRRFRGVATDRSAAEFLLTDPLFPRSVVYALTQAQSCLDALEPPGQDLYSIAARRSLGHARTGLEYAELGEVLAHLPHQMALVQRACAAASDAIRARYFPSGAVTTWVGSML